MEIRGKLNIFPSVINYAIYFVFRDARGVAVNLPMRPSCEQLLHNFIAPWNNIIASLLEFMDTDVFEHSA